MYIKKKTLQNEHINNITLTSYKNKKLREDTQPSTTICIAHFSYVLKNLEF